MTKEHHYCFELRRSMNTENLIKSRKRVKDFAEVYTPNWLVKDMVALAKANEIETTVLEPACGNGNFLAEILEQKLQKGYTFCRNNRGWN